MSYTTAFHKAASQLKGGRPTLVQILWHIFPPAFPVDVSMEILQLCTDSVLLSFVGPRGLLFWKIAGELSKFRGHVAFLRGVPAPGRFECPSLIPCFWGSSGLHCLCGFPSLFNFAMRLCNDFFLKRKKSLLANHGMITAVFYQIINVAKCWLKAVSTNGVTMWHATAFTSKEQQGRPTGRHGACSAGLATRITIPMIMPL